MLTDMKWNIKILFYFSFYLSTKTEKKNNKSYLDTFF